MLEATYDTFEEIPEQYQDLYEERGKKWFIKVNGIVTQADVQKVQRALTSEKQQHELTQKKLDAWGDRDPSETLAELDKTEQYRQAAESTAPDEEKLEQAVKARLAIELGPVQRELDKANGELSKANEQISTFEQAAVDRKIHDSLMEAATENGVDQKQLNDALVIAKNYVEVGEDGEVRTKVEGTDVIAAGCTAKELFQEFKKTKPWLYPPSEGGGSQGGGVSGMSGPNPFDPKNPNYTEQARLMRQDRALAERYAKAAGVTIGQRQAGSSVPEPLPAGHIPIPANQRQ